MTTFASACSILDLRPGRVILAPMPDDAGYVEAALWPCLRDLRTLGACAVLWIQTRQAPAGHYDPAAATEALGMEWHALWSDSVLEPPFRHLWMYTRTRLGMLLAAGAVVALVGRERDLSAAIAAELLADQGASPRLVADALRSAGVAPVLARRAWNDLLRPGFSGASGGRVLACLLGGAVADGFGLPLEFLSLEGIHANFGGKGLTEPLLRDGRLTVSDHTRMTLFTAEGLVRAGEKRVLGNIEKTVTEVRTACRGRLLAQSGGGKRGGIGRLVRRPEMNARHAPGLISQTALARGAIDVPENPRNESKGAGGVMRVAPVGLLPPLTAERAFELAMAAAALTHSHPTGYLAAGTLAALIRMLRAGASIVRAAGYAIELATAHCGHEEVTSTLRRALEHANSGIAPRAAIPHIGEGWVADEALAIGLYSALVGRDFSEVVRIAANHGGDSDTTASLAGQIYGTAHGLTAIPQRWVRHLDVLEPLLTVAHGLITATQPMDRARGYHRHGDAPKGKLQCL